MWLHFEPPASVMLRPSFEVNVGPAIGLRSANVSPVVTARRIDSLSSL